MKKEKTFKHLFLNILSKKELISFEYLEDNNCLLKIKLLKRKRNNLLVNNRYYSLKTDDFKRIKECIDAIDLNDLKPAKTKHKVLPKSFKKKTVFKKEIRVHLDNEFIYVIDYLKLINKSYDINDSSKRIYELIDTVLKILNNYLQI